MLKNGAAACSFLLSDSNSEVRFSDAKKENFGE